MFRALETNTTYSLITGPLALSFLDGFNFVKETTKP